MIRLLHLVAILSLIGSAGYAYSIKYDTLYYAEEVVKVRGRIARERDQIAVAKAEWALLTRPDRLQRMVDQHLDMQPLSMNQVGRMSDLPVRPPKTDLIGTKLEALIGDPVAAAAPKPGTKPPVALAAKPAVAPATVAAAKPAAPPQPAKPKSLSIEALLGMAEPARPARVPRQAEFPATTGSINSESAR